MADLNPLNVTGAGTAGVDGIYTPTGNTSEGLPVYTNGTYFIRSFTGNIKIVSTASGVGTVLYINSAAMPSFVGPYSYVVQGSAPGPTVTEVVPEPTFGLPTDVVNLITARFGTVAKFLRLRNLGQV